MNLHGIAALLPLWWTALLDGIRVLCFMFPDRLTHAGSSKAKNIYLMQPDIFLHFALAWPLWPAFQMSEENKLFVQLVCFAVVFFYMCHLSVGHVELVPFWPQVVWVRVVTPTHPPVCQLLSVVIPVWGVKCWICIESLLDSLSIVPRCVRAIQLVICGIQCHGMYQVRLVVFVFDLWRCLKILSFVEVH